MTHWTLHPQLQLDGIEPQQAGGTAGRGVAAVVVIAARVGRGRVQQKNQAQRVFISPAGRVRSGGRGRDGSRGGGGGACVGWQL